VKLIKIFAPWFIFLFKALVEIYCAKRNFQGFFMGPFINGVLATVVLYWILASTYEQRILQLGLQNREVSKWATGALKWIPGLIMAFGVTEMALLPGFDIGYFVEPRVLMPFGMDLVLFGALVLWKRLGDR